MLDLMSRGALPLSGDWLLGWFAETTVVALALAGLAALGMRARWLAPGPAARHTLWLLVLIKLVTPPLVHWPWSIAAPVAAIRSEPRRVPLVAPEPAASTLTVSISDRAPASPPVRAALRQTTAAEVPPVDPPVGLHLGAWVALVWGGGSIVLGLSQVRQIIRFRRLLDQATPAPAWLTAEAAQVGQRLQVQAPAIRVVPGLSTPVLWCLGRPVVLVPARLLQTLEADRWRSIVAHELAHFRRGDHWVRRLELVAGLIWWWNPLYWLARRRLDFEAELACDAWVVWATPADRLSYAESLIRICTALSATGSPAPALGVVGTGRSFERRLTMILGNQVDRRLSAPSLLAAALLAALALPSWTLAQPPRAEGESPLVTATALPLIQTTTVAADEDDDDDDDQSNSTKNKAKAKKTAKLQAEQDELQKKMDELNKEMETKFGPNSDFAKKMEGLGKEMEAKFGPGSDFAKKMEGLGKEMEAKFGADSDWAKKLGESMKKVDSSRAGEQSSNSQSKQATIDRARAQAERAKLQAERVKGEADRAKARAKSEADRARADGDKAKDRTMARVEGRAKTKPAPDKKARRIEQLEARINEMMAELKQLKTQSQDDDKDDDDDDDDDQD